MPFQTCCDRERTTPDPCARCSPSKVYQHTGLATLCVSKRVCFSTKMWLETFWPLAMRPWVNIQIVPPVNIPIPTKAGCLPQNGIPLVFTTTAIPCRKLFTGQLPLRVSCLAEPLKETGSPPRAERPSWSFRARRKCSRLSSRRPWQAEASGRVLGSAASVFCGLL